jgi:phage tail-like protein
MKVRNALLIIVVAVVLAAGLGLGLARSGNPSASGADETDPVAQYIYVQWDEVSSPISSVSAFEWTTEVKTKKVVTKEGMSIAVTTPGANSYTPIIIERDISDDTQFADWAELVKTGNIGEARRDISIVIYDYEGGVVARWYFVGCWPSAYTSWFDANTMSMPMESLTLVHQGFNRVE